MAKVNPIQLQKYLKGVQYPASKDDLVSAADANGAEGDMKAAIEALPDQQYKSPAEVSGAIGQGD